MGLDPTYEELKQDKGSGTPKQPCQFRSYL